MSAVQKLKEVHVGHKTIDLLIKELSQVVLGKQEELKLSVACLLARGHLLIEDMPGMGKTTLVKALGKGLGLSVSRIQFTNDLLPADILGTNVYDTKIQAFQFLKGPIFGHIVLGDELNRATPKTQSAFLQAMEERRITVDGKTWELPKPFFLIATQNPEEQIGTFPLPESQLDRFMMKISLGFPDRASETKLLQRQNSIDAADTIRSQLDPISLLALQDQSQALFASDAIIHFIQDILAQSRQPSPDYKWISNGLSPRAGILILSAAKAWAFIAGREHVLPEDVQTVTPYVIHHRIVSHYNQTMVSTLQQAEQFVRKVPVPL